MPKARWRIYTTTGLEPRKNKKMVGVLSKCGSTEVCFILEKNKEKIVTDYSDLKSVNVLYNGK